MTTAAARKSVSTTLTSGITRQLVETSAKVIHATFPQVSKAQQASTKYFAIFVTSVSVAGFMALLGINTLLAQDAFTLSNLKVEAKLVADQRDAINRRIDAYSAPESLARSAAALGMKPSETPIFLNLAANGEVKNG
jgi:cell division septal protein FtsQ